MRFLQPSNSERGRAEMVVAGEGEAGTGSYHVRGTERQSGQTGKFWRQRVVMGAPWTQCHGTVHGTC